MTGNKHAELSTDESPGGNCRCALKANSLLFLLFLLLLL